MDSTMPATGPSDFQSDTTIKTSKKTSTYPAPTIVSPSGEHKHTIILLHGRGDTGRDFGSELLISPLSSNNGPVQTTRIPSALPNTKFIFPTAAPRRAKWYNRAVITQWFDNVPIDEQDKRRMTREEDEWQLEGLRESAEFLRGILEEEIRLVGAKNVFVGGLSQGCAMALWFLLGYDGVEALGGFVGMSGWLPFAGDVEEISQASKSVEGEGVDDPFAEAGPSRPSTAVQVCNYVRNAMDLPPLPEGQQPAFLDTPVLMGHGLHDEKVKVVKGRQAAEILRRLDVNDLTFKEYDEGHWYKVPEQLDDIVGFLQQTFARSMRT